ncbi:hypothetical protein RV12_GL002173 [Enterococcus quebecensis]|nr:hypothetical protein RV12_GL002173 [Enterococcus quebecensis]
MGPVHGLKYWYHLSSKDLVEWQEVDIALRPDTEYDSHGVFSGSGLVVGDELFLMYTGNVRTEQWERIPYQLIAKMDTNGKIQKCIPPVIEGSLEGYTDHFRDPKLWEQSGKYYAVIGVQRQNETGACLLFQSEDVLNWSSVGEIQTSLQNFGYMWECPDYFELEGYGVLLFSPQGLEPLEDQYQNIYQTGYIVGQPLEVATGEFDHDVFQELDAGFDFYATQTTVASDGRRILFAWMGLPEIAYPSDKDNWAHCLTIPRELQLVNGRLYQQPIKELRKLRKENIQINPNVSETQQLSELTGITYELETELSSTAEQFGLLLRGKGKKGTKIYVDQVKQKLILDRTDSGFPFAENYGTIRQVPYKKSTIKLHIFVDTSSIEIFVNDGEVTFTARIFTEDFQNEISVISENGTTQAIINKWTI